MFPLAPPGGTVDLPPSASFWTPKPGDLTDEGFGGFHNTWLIKDVPVGYARSIIAAESAIAASVGALAGDADDFERLASAAESGEIDAYNLSEDEREQLGGLVRDDYQLGGLELGVAGLAYALAAVRILPAASCRSHVDPTWSDAPVVFFASTEFRAQALQPLAAATGCTFSIDPYRSKLLVVCGRSILNTMALAAAVLHNRDSFVQHRSEGERRPASTRRPESKQEQASQPYLFRWP